MAEINKATIEKTVKPEVFKRANDVAVFVADFLAKENRGCPAGVLRYVAKFEQKDIDNAISLNMIEGTRGREGGYYPFGQIPVPQDVSPSLKARMAEALQMVMEGKKVSRETVKEILADYEKEMKMRAEVLEKARNARTVSL